MKRMFVVVVLVTALSFTMMPMFALAQDSDTGAENPEVPNPADVQNILAWATEDPPNYTVGIWFGIIGLGSALASSYFLIGSVLPGTAGKKDIDQRSRELDEMQKRWETYRQLVDSLALNPQDPSFNEAKVNLYNDLADKQGDDLRSARTDLNRVMLIQYLIALPLYGVLGALAAMFFATDYLQALVLGAGGPAVIGSRGLKSDFGELNTEHAQLKEDVAEYKAQVEPTIHAEVKPALQDMQRILAPMVVNPEAELGKRAPDALADKIDTLQQLATHIESSVEKIQPP